MWATPEVLVKKDWVCPILRRLQIKWPNSTHTWSKQNNSVDVGCEDFKCTKFKICIGTANFYLTLKARKHMAFRKRRGLFQFQILPFGLKNSPITFVKFMNEVLRGFFGWTRQIFVDDIVIYSKYEKTSRSLKQWHNVVEQLLRFGLTCHAKKCRVGTFKISFYST